MTDEQPKPREFTQEDLDRIIAGRLAEEAVGDPTAKKKRKKSDSQ